MKNLLQGKRIFKQETSDFSRFLALNKENISKYYYFYDVVGVRKGDLLNPSKWEVFKDTAIISIDVFEFDEYEYLFHIDKWIVKELQKIIGDSLGIQIDNNLNNLLEIKSISNNYTSLLRTVLSEVAYTKDGVSIVEAYKYSDNNKYIILDIELTDDDISYEYTDEFLELEAINTYQRGNKGTKEYLVKASTQRGNSIEWQEERWYYINTIKGDSLISITEIHEIEEIITFTNFTETESV